MDKLKEFYKKYRTDIFKPTIVLLCICIIIPLALGLTNKVTKDKISKLEKQNQEKAMSRLIKADEYTSDTLNTDNGEVEYFVAVTSKKTVGYIFIVNSKGYGGDVSVMTAVNKDGTVKAVEILDVSNETPGLGQNAAKESFYSQFTDKEAGISLVKGSADEKNNEINAITGATITSKAVTKSVNTALSYYEIASKNK